MCFKISNAPTIKLIPTRMKTETENLAQLTQTILEPLSTPPRPEQGHRVSLDRAIVNTSSLSLFSLFPLLGLSLSRSLSLLRSLSFPWPSWSLTLSLFPSLSHPSFLDIEWERWGLIFSSRAWGRERCCSPLI